MLCRLLNGVKMDGIRHAPGAVLDITEEDFAKLPVGTAVPTDAPPASPSPEPESAAAQVEPAAVVEAVTAETSLPPEESVPPVVEDLSAEVSTG